MHAAARLLRDLRDGGVELDRARLRTEWDLTASPDALADLYDKGVIAVTARRLLVFGIKQGMLKMKIQDVRSSIPREQLSGWTYKPGRLTSILAMAFADDSDVAIEMPRVNKPDAFAEAAGVPFAS